jgi:DNA (cytosine-5)-methyltransferase 1
MAKMRAVEIYAGVGGLSVGLEAAGMDVIAGHDRSLLVHAIRSANGLHGAAWDPTDIGKLAADFVRAKVDLIAGAPYTQHLFESGREGAQKRARLTLSFALLIGAVRPEWFIYEDFSTACRSSAYQDARLLWKKYGYGLTELVLDASRYEVAQRRRRLMVVGRLGEEEGFLDDPIRRRAEKKSKTVREVLDPHDPEDAALLERSTYYTRPLHSGSETGRSIDRPAPAIYHDFRKVPEGVDQLELGLHQLTLIQSFPRRFNWVDIDGVEIEMDGLERIISSAVPPALAYHVGKSIVDRHTGAEIPECHEEFKEWFRRTKKWATGPINNVASRVKKGRELLGGRTFANAKEEAAALEKVAEFQAMNDSGKSEIRSALREYANFRTGLSKKSFNSSKTQPEKKEPSPRERWRALRGASAKSSRWTYESLQLKPPSRPQPGRSKINLNASRRGNTFEDLDYENEDFYILPSALTAPDEP